MSNPDHVVIENKSFVCLHCNARYTPTFPIPVNMYTAMVKSFLSDHRRCKPIDLQKRFDGNDFQSF